MPLKIQDRISDMAAYSYFNLIFKIRSAFMCGLRHTKSNFDPIFWSEIKFKWLWNLLLYISKVGCFYNNRQNLALNLISRTYNVDTLFCLIGFWTLWRLILLNEKKKVRHVGKLWLNMIWCVCTHTAICVG